MPQISSSSKDVPGAPRGSPEQAPDLLPSRLQHSKRNQCGHGGNLLSQQLFEAGEQRFKAGLQPSTKLWLCIPPSVDSLGAGHEEADPIKAVLATCPYLTLLIHRTRHAPTTQLE